MLEESARDLGDRGRDATFGWGLVQMNALCPVPATPGLDRAKTGKLKRETFDRFIARRQRSLSTEF
jgi:hypothetical protein